MAVGDVADGGEEHYVGMGPKLGNELRQRGIGVEFGPVFCLKFLQAVLAVGVIPFSQRRRGRHVLRPQIVMKLFLRLSSGPQPVDKHAKSAGVAPGVVVHSLYSYRSIAHILHFLFSTPCLPTKFFPFLRNRQGCRSMMLDPPEMP